MADFSVLSSRLANLFSAGPVSAAASLAATCAWAFLAFRAAQRLHYVVVDGRRHPPCGFDPRRAMASFLQASSVAVSHHEVISRDGVGLKYTCVGSGPKAVLLCNGVGTDLFMWLPVFQELCRSRGTFFEEFTLVCPSYRGLFGCDRKPKALVQAQSQDSQAQTQAQAEKKRGFKAAKSSSMPGPRFRSLSPIPKGAAAVAPVAAEVSTQATIELCGGDCAEVLAHLRAFGPPSLRGAFQFHAVIGWSLGAATALTALSAAPALAGRAFLLNPTSGETLHTGFQPFAPLPAFAGAVVSRAACALLSGAKPLVAGAVFDAGRWICAREALRWVVLEPFFSFLGGGPPEQGAYFQCYMRDVFATRMHTSGLLDLILALDAPLPEAAHTLPHPTRIVAGLPDILTGVYHATRLASTLPRSSLRTLALGSHFLLLEQPAVVASELLGLLDAPASVDRRREAAGVGQHEQLRGRAAQLDRKKAKPQ